MTAAPYAELAYQVAGPDDAVHVVCCDEDLAQCGVNLSGDFMPDECETTCRVCAIADVEDLPCGDPECPYRDDEADR